MEVNYVLETTRIGDEDSVEVVARLSDPGTATVSDTIKNSSAYFPLVKAYIRNREQDFQDAILASIGTFALEHELNKRLLNEDS